MQQQPVKCTRCVGNESVSVKYGSTKGGNQRYLCRHCGKTFVEHYKYKALQSGTSQWITSLLTEGCGIRSIARLLAISVTTVLKRILSISKSITKPAIALYKEYEIDELRTYYKSKNRLLWIACALLHGHRHEHQQLPKAKRAF